LKITYITRG